MSHSVKHMPHFDECDIWQASEQAIEHFSSRPQDWTQPSIQRFTFFSASQVVVNVLQDGFGWTVLQLDSQLLLH